MEAAGDILADFAPAGLDVAAAFRLLDFHATSYSLAYCNAEACHEKSLLMPLDWMRRHTAGSFRKVASA